MTYSFLASPRLVCLARFTTNIAVIQKTTHIGTLNYDPLRRTFDIVDAAYDTAQETHWGASRSVRRVRRVVQRVDARTFAE